MSIIEGTVCTSVTYRGRARGIGQSRNTKQRTCAPSSLECNVRPVIYEPLEGCILSSRSPGGSRLSTTGAIYGPSGNIFMAARATGGGGGRLPLRPSPTGRGCFSCCNRRWLARPVFHTSLIAPPMRSDNRPNSARRSLIFGRR